MSGWNVKAASAAMRTTNPIRELVDKLKIEPREDKEFIALSIGDPTVFGNMPVADTVKEALHECVDKCNRGVAGYAPSMGQDVAREAIAKKFTREEAPLTKDDIIVCSGCSGALELTIAALAQEGDNIVIPRPGFSLYRTLCERLGVGFRYYDLLPSKGWESDLGSMEAAIDENTKAILINNPSNPCGSVFSKEHLEGIMALAKKHHLPIVSDEIYADMVFSHTKFFPIASLSDEVPVFTVGGISKQYVAPGWRVGWIMVHDPKKVGEEIREGIRRLSTCILGANTLVQAALPKILHETPVEYYEKLNKMLEEHAGVCVDGLKNVNGLNVIVPSGAMYVMVEVQVEKFADITSDVDFCQKLLDEESVFVLPGAPFQAPNYFRVVTCPPPDKLREAAKRIQDFCKRHMAQ